ncbi:MAG TPA: hypothetical protein VHE13_15125 [Opitutus sp.]|nr:hypothetical protein [Opitutus sp.]
MHSIKFPDDELQRIRQLIDKYRDGDDENAKSDLWQEYGLTLVQAVNMIEFLVSKTSVILKADPSNPSGSDRTHGRRLDLH